MANSKDKFDIAIAFSGHIRDLTYVRYGFVDATYKMAWLHGSLSDYMLLSYAFGDLYRGIRNLCVLSTEGQDYVFQVCRFLEDELSVSHLANPVDDLGVVNEDVARRLSEEYGPYLLMVGRFDQDKDQKTVIRALRILFDKYPERCKLLFVGDGPTQEECKVLASNLELDDCVVFEGARMDVVNYYSSAAVLVHSSPSEGLPTVVLEGLAAGVPVVATRSLPGVPAILGADEYGLTCQVGNPEDLAEKIHAMLASNDLRERYRCAGLKRVQEYSREAVSQKLAIVLQNLIESN